LLEKKQLFISQIMNNNLSCRSFDDDIDERALEYAEVKAICCGDPRIKEKVDLENEIQKLSMEKNSFLKTKYNYINLVETAPARIERMMKKIDAIRHDILKIENYPKDEFKILMGNVEVLDIDIIRERIKKLGGFERIAGRYKNFDLEIRRGSVLLKGNYELNIKLGRSKIERVISTKYIRDEYKKVLDNLIIKSDKLKKDFEYAREHKNDLFSKENVLFEKIERQKILKHGLEDKKDNNINDDKEDIKRCSVQIR
jgi:hypothetical protein